MKNYKENVLHVNAQMKVEKASLNGAIKLLLLLAPLSKEQKAFFTGILKDEQKYIAFQAKVRKTKKGNYTPFACLQCWYKN